MGKIFAFLLNWEYNKGGGKLRLLNKALKAHFRFLLKF